MEKKCQNILGSKNFKQTLRHQEVETEAVEAEALRVKAEAIQKLPLPHPWFKRNLVGLSPASFFRSLPLPEDLNKIYKPNPTPFTLIL